MTLHAPFIRSRAVLADSAARATPWPTRHDRSLAIKTAATAIVTRIHGPRPVIVNAPMHSHYGLARDTTSTVRMMAAIDRNWSSMSEAFAWDRKVSALVRAVADERRVLK